jgi:hypothetical protein
MSSEQSATFITTFITTALASLRTFHINIHHRLSTTRLDFNNDSHHRNRACEFGIVSEMRLQQYFW